MHLIAQDDPVTSIEPISVVFSEF